MFETIGRRPRGKHCDAILCLIADIRETISGTGPAGVRDAAILAAVQAAVHYQIARYGMLIAWAVRLNEHGVSRLLRSSLEEEKSAAAVVALLAAASVNHAAKAA